MVSYGEWVQPPDQTVVNSVAEYDVASAVITRERPLPPEVQVEDLALAFEDVQAEEPPPSPPGVQSAGYGWVHEARLGEIYAVWSAHFARYRFTVPPPGPVAYLPELPAGAIGLEYEGAPYDPSDPYPVSYTQPHSIGVSASTPLRSDSFDETNSTDGTLSNSDWTTSLVAEGAVVGTIPGTFGGVSGEIQPLGALADLTAAFGPTMSGQVWTETRTFVPPTDMPSIDDVGGAAFQVNYGWRIAELRIALTATPPRFRWVYADGPVLTHRRTYPRDDGLAGGAPRTWPPSKTTQSSNRTFGGYL